VSAMKRPIVVYTIAMVLHTAGSVAQYREFEIEAGPFSDVVSEFYVAPDHSVYIGSGRSGVLHSTDNGRTWQLENQGLPTTTLASLTLEPASKTLVTALKNGALYRFDYQSRQWSQFGNARFQNPNIMASQRGALYAYDSTYGVDRSLDGAQTWERVFIPGEHGFPVLFNGATYEDDVLIGTKYGGIFHSSNSGDSWSNSYTKGLEVASVFYSSTGMAIASNSSEGLRSTDRGKQWTALQSGLGGLTSLSEEQVGILWSCNGRGWRSTDTGRTWTGLPYIQGTYRLVRVDSGIVLHAARNKGLGFHADSANGGYNTSDDFSFMPTFAIASTHRQSLLASSETNTYRSTTSGLIWTKVQFGSRGEAVALRIVADTLGHIFATLRDGSIWKSIDDGVNWNMVVPDSITKNGVQLLFVRPDGDVFFSTPDQRLWFSSNQGSDWRSTRTLGTVFALGVISGRVIIAGTDSGTFRSLDYGVSFGPNTWQCFTAFDIRGDGAVINAGTRTDLYRSLDSGSTWVKQFSDGKNIKIVEFLETRDNLLLAGGAYVCQSLDGGLTWKRTGTVGAVGFYQWVALPSGDILGATQAKGLMRARPVSGTVEYESPRSLPSSLSLSSPWPNPASSSAAIAITLQHSGMLRCTVTSMLGERIATLSNAERNAGTHVLSWDGRSEPGLRVPPGLYFINAEMDGAVVSRAMIRLNR
jgi:photosystem II stability/assembly factor-like uncharacterized protein